MNDNTPILFIPGFACNFQMWESQRAAFAARPTLVADHAGADSIAALAGRILAAAPPRFGLCGFSMGGYIALEIMASAPERVARLALMDTQAPPESEAARTARLERMAVARTQGMRAAAAHNWATMVHPDHVEDAALRRIGVDMAEATGLEAFLRQAEAIMTRRDAAPVLPTIAVPTLIVVGEADALTPPARAREMAQAIAGAELAVVADAGHMTTIEQPQAVNAMLTRFFG